MIPQPLITITQNRIEKALSDLRKEIIHYETVENNIQTNVDRLLRLKNQGRMHMFSHEGFELTAVLNDANNDMRNINQRALREIDSMTAVIAGYLSLLIDECIENYSAKLKIWIKIRLSQLNDLREIKVSGSSRYLIFPTANGILTPYVIKTRLCDEETSQRFVSIRNRIRELSEPSY